MRLFHALLLALALAAPGVAHAQGTHGFMLSGRLLGASLTVDPDEGDSQTESGGGFGGRLGYGFSDRFTVFAALDLAAIKPEDDQFEASLEDGRYGLGAIDLGVRANFPAGRTIVPYAEAALTGQALAFDLENTDTDITVSGGGITLGGGAQFFVSRTLAVDVGLGFTFGQFNEAEIDGEDANIEFDLEDTDTFISRLGVGLSFYPSRTR